MENQLDLFNQSEPTGEELRDRGIKQSKENANALHKEWSEQAFSFLKSYIQLNTVFMTEDIRVASDGIVPVPPSLRAWGSVILRAAKGGLVKKIGYRSVSNAKAHKTPATVWEVIR